MQLAFTARRMLRSAHLTLFPFTNCIYNIIHFTVQFDFTVSDRYISPKKYILHRWVRRDGLISALVTTSSPRLKARALCGDLC